MCICICKDWKKSDFSTNILNLFVSSQFLAFLTDWFHSACGLTGDQTIDRFGNVIWNFEHKNRRYHYPDMIIGIHCVRRNHVTASNTNIQNVDVQEEEGNQ